MARAPKFNMPIVGPAAAAAVTMPLNTVIEALLALHNDGSTVRPSNIPEGAIWAASVAGVTTVYQYVGEDTDIAVWVVNNGIVMSTALTTRAGMLRIGTDAEHLTGTNMTVAAVPGRVQKMIEQRAVALEKLISDKIGAAIPTIQEGDVGATLIVGADLKLKTDQMEQRLTTKINAVVPEKLPTDTGKFLQVGPAPGLAFRYAAVELPAYLTNSVEYTTSGTWVAPKTGFITIVAHGGSGGGGGSSRSDGDWYVGHGGAGGDAKHLRVFATIPVTMGDVIAYVIGAGGTGGAGGGASVYVGYGGNAGGVTFVTRQTDDSIILTAPGAPGGGGAGYVNTMGGAGQTSVFGPLGGAGGPVSTRPQSGRAGLLGGGGAGGVGDSYGAYRAGRAGSPGSGGSVTIYY